MSSFQLIIAPDSRLSECCEPVTEVDDSIRLLMDNMLAIMQSKQGIGLAASQIGVLKDVFVANVPVNPEIEEDQEFCSHGGPFFIVNPRIVYKSDDCAKCFEGCLSIPGSIGMVSRPTKVIVEYLDRDGKDCKLKASDWLARCIQHEFDHLRGILYIDYLSQLKKRLAIQKSQKIKKSLS